jgi:uncharacterized protein YjeT (DUF2065 family)
MMTIPGTLVTVLGAVVTAVGLYATLRPAAVRAGYAEQPHAVEAATSLPVGAWRLAGVGTMLVGALLVVLS